MRPLMANHTHVLGTSMQRASFTASPTTQSTRINCRLLLWDFSFSGTERRMSDGLPLAMRRRGVKRRRSGWLPWAASASSACTDAHSVSSTSCSCRPLLQQACSLHARNSAGELLLSDLFSLAERLNDCNAQMAHKYWPSQAEMLYIVRIRAMRRCTPILRWLGTVRPLPAICAGASQPTQRWCAWRQARCTTTGQSQPSKPLGAAYRWRMPVRLDGAWHQTTRTLPPSGLRLATQTRLQHRTIRCPAVQSSPA